MSDEKRKTLGNPIKIELENDFEPKLKEIKDTQKLASETSLLLLGLLEAEEYKEQK